MRSHTYEWYDAHVDLNFPASAVVPSAHGPVLAVLARTTEPLTGRQIAALTRPPVSQKQTATVLHALTRTGLVTATSAGPANLYLLNRDHMAADAVIELATIRERLWDRIRDHASAWTHPPAGLVVYGSAARGDGTLDSDIDLLLIRPDGVHEEDPQWAANVIELATAIDRWTGNPPEILEYTHGELAAMAAAGEPLLGHIRRDGLFILGARFLVPAPIAA